MLLTPCIILFRISSSLSALCSKLYALYLLKIILLLKNSLSISSSSILSSMLQSLSLLLSLNALLNAANNASVLDPIFK